MSAAPVVVVERLPQPLLAVGIEGSRLEAGAGLSPEIEWAVDRVAFELRSRLGEAA